MPSDTKSVWNGYLGWGKFALAVVLAFVHATFVVAGIYVSISGRLTALETKVDFLWERIGKVLDRVEPRR